MKQNIWLHNNTTIMCFIWWLSLSHLNSEKKEHPTGCQGFCNLGGNSRKSTSTRRTYCRVNKPRSQFHVSSNLVPIQHQSLFFCLFVLGDITFPWITFVTSLQLLPLKYSVKRWPFLKRLSREVLATQNSDVPTYIPRHQQSIPINYLLHTLDASRYKTAISLPVG